MKVRDGIVLFKGKTSRNLLLHPMVSNAYFLEDGDEVILFDPSCGKEIAKRIEGYIHKRREAQTSWKKAVIIAGHSHMDHANNFYLSDKLGANETHIYVHASGFKNGEVMNEPVSFFTSAVEESNKYYPFYSCVFAPTSLLLYPIKILSKASYPLAVRVFSRLGALPWPPPVNGSTRPEPLKEEDARIFNISGNEVKGWQLGNKIILSTPGHSPCSVSLFWPEQKALFISDADWFGNPVFVSSSLKGCKSSLEMMKKITQAGEVELLLPGHGEVIEGAENIVSHIDYCIQRLETMRSEVLSAHQAYNEKNVLKLTEILVNEYTLFKTLKRYNYPKDVILVPNIVTVCLKEEGIIA
jgi:glyoxylase-like metal-dependent hydrolase (beta-lactamase superfamily II)